MNYTHKNLNELGEQRVVKTGSKVAMFVPRLLAKLSVKLVVNPITKAVTGQTFEQVKDAAVDLTMQMQAVEADVVKKQLDKEVENYSNLVNGISGSKDLLVSNIAVCKDSQSVIESLSRRYNRLTSAPKRLLVAKNYLKIMKVFSEVRQNLENNNVNNQDIIEMFEVKREAYVSKNNEVKSLEERLLKLQQEQAEVTEKLGKSKEELEYLRQDAETFEKENYDVINNTKEETKSAVAEQNEVPSVNPTVTVTPVIPTPQPVVENPTVEQNLSGMVQPLERPNVQKVKVRVVNPKTVSEPVVSPKVEETKNETELSPSVLEQVNSFAMPAVELEEKAPQMPMFNSLNSVPVQTEADRLFLEQMGSFARQGMPMNASANLETYGLEETKTR